MPHMSYKTWALLYSCKRKNSVCTDLNITNTTMLGIQFEAWKEGTFSKLDTNEQDTFF